MLRIILVHYSSPHTRFASLPLTGSCSVCVYYNKTDPYVAGIIPHKWVKKCKCTARKVIATLYKLIHYRPGRFSSIPHWSFVDDGFFMEIPLTDWTADPGCIALLPPSLRCLLDCTSAGYFLPVSGWLCAAGAGNLDDLQLRKWLCEPIVSVGKSSVTNAGGAFQLSVDH